MVVYSDELCHWAKGSVGKNHKYIHIIIRHVTYNMRDGNLALSID